jgi:tetratricopeptide (TPR) repeat protein/predicted aspartyl protease
VRIGGRRRLRLGAALLGAALTAAGAATAACEISKLADLPVTMSGLSPLIPAKINGKDVRFILDSGAFYSMIFTSAASELHLDLTPTSPDYRVVGVGGAANASITNVRQFTLAGVPIPNVKFLVVAGVGGGDETGLLGQNVLGLADVEYDFANGVIRLMRPKGCGKAALAYWSGPTKTFSMEETAYTTSSGPHINGLVKVNGRTFSATFDTGAPVSYLSLSAAARAGIKTNNSGVVEAGLTGGIGRRLVNSWIALVDSLEIGDNEKILHTRLRIADFSQADTDMLIGADFFLSHRVYVANSQHRLYFTYNGGPVFNLDVAPQAVVGSPPPPPPATIVAAAGGPTNAADYARLGAALTARRNYQEAIANFSKAIELAPASAEYRVLRAHAYFHAGQSVPAMADVEGAVQLAPSDADALILRAEARLSNGNKDGATTDLKAASATLPLESGRRLELANLYQSADAFPAAIAELDLWIKNHRDEGGAVEALNARCWARALMGQELDKALSDCDASLSRFPNNASGLDSRGLVRLRLGDYDKAVADYDRSLKLSPKNAWSLYGRGMAKLKLNRAAEGKADISAAEAINPHIADEARKHGLTP